MLKRVGAENSLTQLTNWCPEANLIPKITQYPTSLGILCGLWMLVAKNWSLPELILYFINYSNSEIIINRNPHLGIQK
jgi:hypothetical protein